MHGIDRFGAWRVVGRMGLEEDAAAVRAPPGMSSFRRLTPAWASARIWRGRTSTSRPISTTCSSVLEFEDLKDVTLIGHSYGGMVATGVADQAADRIARVVYLDAFAPKDGQSLFDLVGPKAEATCAAAPTSDGDGWKHPADPMPPDTSPEDVAWADAAPPAAADQDLRAEAPDSRRTSHRRRAITSTPRRTGRATCSASSPTAPGARPAGSTTRSTPATIRTSPAPTC